MSFDFELKINNQEITDGTSLVRVHDPYPIFTWSFEKINHVEVGSDGKLTDSDDYSQISYEIRISDYSFEVGSDSFKGSILRTDVVAGQDYFYKYFGYPLSRGIHYYGQIRIIDSAGRISYWKTFCFEYNILPYVTNVNISPVKPSVTDNLVLNYNYNDGDNDTEGDTKIRWFKNGIQQTRFNDELQVGYNYLQNNDIWYADVYPYDGYEYGDRVSSPSVKVSKTAITVSDVKVLPDNPNPNDILKVSYVVSNDDELDNVLIRWYINNYLISEHNDKIYIRPSVSSGDTVRVEIKHKESGLYVSSDTVTVSSSNFYVYNMRIDGQIDPLEIYSLTPVITWSAFVPDNKEISNVSVKIGSFFEADDIYSDTFVYNKNFFSIPANLLMYGRDYYISVAVSDSTVFDNYVSSHFRTYGSLWEKHVSNSTGWTIETILYTEGSTSNNDYQVIRINDGSKFAEVRIYYNKISLISEAKEDYTINTTDSIILTIIGKGSDIKIFANRELIIDGTGLLTQESSIKRLEVGSASDSTLIVNYKYFNYSVSGYYIPGQSEEYQNIQFHTFMEFDHNSIVALKGYINGKYIFGLNPDNENEGGKIYMIDSGSSVKIPTVNRTYSPINKIRESFDSKKTVCSHSKGVSILTGYNINLYNNELIFIDDRNELVDNSDPIANGWELMSNVNFDGYYFDEDGLNINTIGRDLQT